MRITAKHFRKLVLIHVILALVLVFFVSEFQVPWNSFYILDLFLIIEFFYALAVYVKSRSHFSLNGAVIYFFLFMIWLIFSNIIGGFSYHALLLAFRKMYRFYMFFFVCSVLLIKEDLDFLEKSIKYIITINLILTLYQHFFLGLYGDFLGGIFGTEKGCNVYSNIFLCLVSVYYVCKYLDNKIKADKMLLVLGSSFVVAVLAELKIFFLEITVIVCVSILLFKPTWRTVKTVVLFLAILVIGIIAFVQIFPEQAELLYKKEAILKYTTEVNYGYNIGRLSAFRDINELFFHDNSKLQLLGYGFGHCEEGTLFYELYGHYHYTWFTHQIILLELGILGAIIYIYFFIYAYWHANKKKVKKYMAYYIYTQVTCVLCFIWFFYNQALRMEVGYIIFLVLAIPNIVSKQGIKKLSNY